MRGFEDKRIKKLYVTTNDIEMVCEAWKKNAMQNFVNSWFSNDISEVVRDQTVRTER